MSRADEGKSLDARLLLLERRANVVRSRLYARIDALDTRRRQVTELGHRAKALAFPVGASVAAVAALLAAGAIGLRLTMGSRRRDRGLPYRVGRLIDGLGAQQRKPPLFAEVGRKVLLTVVTVVASSVARHVAMNFIDGRTPSGRLVTPRVDPPPALPEHAPRALAR